jgi:hypothetical protein
MISVRRLLRSARLPGLSLLAILTLGASPVAPQINPVQPAPMQQGPVTGELPLSDPPPVRSRDRGPVVAAAQGGAALRVLDKISGRVADMTLVPGGSARVGGLTVVLQECRYPVDDPASNAYAFLTISEDGRAEPLFRGWMIANSPALNALDHPRYDIWLRHCRMTDAGEGGQP